MCFRVIKYYIYLFTYAFVLFFYNQHLCFSLPTAFKNVSVQVLINLMHKS